MTASYLPTSNNRHFKNSILAKLFKRTNKRVATETLSGITQAYNILPQITGHGIAGQVRHCIHRPSSQVRAVKTIAKGGVQRKDQIEREVSFLKTLDHPNIVRLHDVYEDKDSVHIVTELCRGGELFDSIVERVEMNQSPECFNEKDTVRIIRSLLSAVSYLHSKDIVHRDIKPENILFTEQNNCESPIKLIDFGLSVSHTPNCSPLTHAVGTSYYMAPELLEGSYDRSCDLWAIGVIAYVLLSGQPPFDGPNDNVIFQKIKRGHFKMADSPLWDDVVSPVAKDFVRCLLDRNVQRRWTADMALDHPWLQLARVDELFGGN